MTDVVSTEEIKEEPIVETVVEDNSQLVGGQELPKVPDVPDEDCVHFHLPDYSGHFKLNYLFATLRQAMPQLFNPLVKIGSVYGSFPGAIWNGGRTMIGSSVAREDMKQIYGAFNELGIPVRHTFTNQCLTDTMVYDTYCNIITELGHNGLNEILVNSPILEEYIREKYPKYPIISSTTKRLTNIEDVEKELEKDYKLVVLDYALNRNPEIYSLPHKERFEILIDAYCCDDCPRRRDHYKELSTDQVSFGHIGDNPPMSCEFIGETFYDVLNKRKSALKVDEIYGFYYDMGFRHFKIEGRTTNPFDVLESYIYYMILPEWQNYARLIMLKRLFAQDQPPQQQPMMVVTQEEFERMKAEGQVQLQPQPRTFMSSQQDNF